MTRVLVVDDEPQILRALTHQPARPPLRGAHGRHRDRRSAAAASPAAGPRHSRPRAARHRRRRRHPRAARAGARVPIVVLSGRTDSADKVDALDAGADDYLTKPFGVDELLARMRAVSRRADARRRRSDGHVRGRHRATWPPGESRIATRTVRSRSGSRRPSGTSWRCLLRHPGKLLSQRQLLSEVWGPGYETAQGNLRVYMAQLRRKLEADPARPRHLLTEPGMGYRFEPHGVATSPAP